jgi:septum formation protein
LILSFSVRIVLASASPRRAELLRAAGFEFETCFVDVDESVRSGETPAAYVRRLAAEKSASAASYVAAGRSTSSGPPRASSRGGFSRTRKGPTQGPPEGGHHNHETVVLGADTTVVVDDAILGKPRNDRDVAAMLRRLSGRRHEVLTGVSVRRDGVELGLVESTAVHFAELSASDIEWYVASGEGRDKAGAYAIQGLASRFIPRLEGSYSNVVGLPIASVVRLLREISGTRPDR